jgi:hypothetical protein
MGSDVLGLVADAYRTGGPLRQQVAARSFLTVMSRQDVEEQIGALLDSGSLVAGPGGTVGLAPAVRASLLSRSVIDAWRQEAIQAPTVMREVLTAGIRAELREVARHCLTAPEASGLARRGVELVAVLTMADLDPRVIHVVAGLPGTTRSQLRDLATVPEGSCRSLKEFQAGMRRFVQTQFLDDARE